jgi:hypothetical protein
MSTKDELIADLRAQGVEVVAAFRAVPDANWDQGRYEGGWNARQILAHIASIEWTYARLVDLANAPAAGGSHEARSAPPTGGMDGYNARQVEKRANATVEELIAEFERNRSATIASVESADAALFEVVVRSAGGRVGTLAQVFREVAIGHVGEHVRDVVGS